MKFWVNNEVISFNVCKSLRQPMDLKVVSIINEIDYEVVNVMEVDFTSDTLVGVFWNIWKEEVEEYDELVSSLMGFGTYSKNPCNLDLALKNLGTPPIKPSIIEPPNLI